MKTNHRTRIKTTSTEGGKSEEEKGVKGDLDRVIHITYTAT